MNTRTDNILIGIDGGGTGCRVAIETRQGVRLGAANGGPANPTNDPQQALTSILATIEAARIDAGVDVEIVAAANVFVGLAGISNDEIAALIAKALPIKRARVVEDRITTVTGALKGADGAVAAIGTGSFVARSVPGDTQYVGGWSFPLGDQASGAWLGHRLLRNIVLCVDGIKPHTPLTRATLARYDNDTHKIYDFANRAAPVEFGELAPLVITAAKEGDLTATTLMQEGADYIAQSLMALGYQAGEALCLTGGLGPHYADFLPSHLTERLIDPKGSALEGALLLAAKMGPVSLTA